MSCQLYLLGSDNHVPGHQGADSMQHQGEVDQVESRVVIIIIRLSNISKTRQLKTCKNNCTDNWF